MSQFSITTPFPLTNAGAFFSEDRSRRYLLWRRVKSNDDLPYNKGKDFVIFIGLNPSIADENRLDPTVTRCYKFAERWGFHWLLMGNLYSKVSTDPKGVDFKHVEEESENYFVLWKAMDIADLVIVAWGTNADEVVQDDFVRGASQNGIVFHSLGVNNDGSPKHPLYLKGTTVPVEYR